MTYPENVGIVAIEIYFPKRCIEQAELEKFDKVSTGKYTIGLGQTKMGFCDDREAVQNLIEKYKISYKDIGRVEVGTETIIDKSKSVKSVLMQLFVDSGNTDVEGIDTKNACYGGTSALFNSLDWVESSSWDGRYALVVAGDIAVYASGPARPTGGAGCVAMLIGKDAPIVFDRDLTSEFPVVDGHLSNSCYLKALDICYNRYIDKLEKVEDPTIKFFDYALFHSPYCKLVQKSYARLFYNDFKRNPTLEGFESVLQFQNIDYEESLRSKELEKALVGISNSFYQSRVLPTLLLATQIGNMYCASLYGTLVSLLSSEDVKDLIGKRVAMFSYGSGLSSSFFSFQIRKSVKDISEKLNIKNRLDSRLIVQPEKFAKVMNSREETHGEKDFEPNGDNSSIDETMFEGTYYLEKIDSKWRRFYKRR
ncbi:18189_t:CDS:2 [Entrophospora sp. SA101]|nr:3317_t:CDS:2 [Entrophospora sp. SA101]CAJ0767512.1 18189_t:CDS:2 [Entrophospora sp. SA101]CAJ0832838.1 13936_t:CDS:2 [Entrophospora sp. SA101]CAJ0835382.1 21863_t:CDS:2 [Entrophospora sp. SA101]CAJ0896985.1 12645_t:CDS:2 [Entrophospora sp. SA101]